MEKKIALITGITGQDGSSTSWKRQGSSGLLKEARHVKLKSPTNSLWNNF